MNLFDDAKDECLRHYVDMTSVVAASVPHAVVPQLLRPVVGAWVSPATLGVGTPFAVYVRSCVISCPADKHAALVALTTDGCEVEHIALDTGIAKGDLATIASIPSIRSVALKEPAWSSMDLSPLEALPQLTSLSLSNVIVSGAEMFQSIGRLSSLTELSLDFAKVAWINGNRRANDFIAGLAPLLPTLEVFALTESWVINGERQQCFYDAIAKMNALRRLNLRRTHGLDVMALLRSASGLPSLASMAMCISSADLGDDDGGDLNFPALETLSMECVVAIGNVTRILRDIGGGLTSLTLTLPSTPDSFLEVLSSLVSLRELTVHDAANIFLPTMTAIVSLPRLTTLHFKSSCVHHECFEVLCQSTTIRDLAITFNPSVRGGRYAALAAMRQLTRLDLRYCSLDVPDVEAFATLPALTELCLDASAHFMLSDLEHVKFRCALPR